MPLAPFLRKDILCVGGGVWAEGNNVTSCNNTKVSLVQLKEAFKRVCPLNNKVISCTSPNQTNNLYQFQRNLILETDFEKKINMKFLENKISNFENCQLIKLGAVME